MPAALEIGPSHGLVRCEAAWRWEREGFDDFDLWIVLDGRGELHLEGQAHELSAGFSMCFSPGPARLRAWHDARRPLQVFYCHFRVRPPRGAALPPLPGSSPVQVDAEGLVRETAMAIANPPRAAGGAAFREALLWQLLLGREAGGGVATTSSPQERLAGLVRRIAENPATCWNVDDLARQAGMSAGHFRRTFQVLTGKPPLQYILDHRLQRACYYLRETRLPIGEVAAATGYTDVFYFSRQFKERMGCTPSAYRGAPQPR